VAEVHPSVAQETHGRAFVLKVKWALDQAPGLKGFDGPSQAQSQQLRLQSVDAEFES
jgi:hypothetical protein